MVEQQKPTDRLNYTGELTPIINRLSAAYGVGVARNFTVIDVGYEDCNVVLETENGKYLAKMFAKIRSDSDIERYTTIMQKVVEAGVNHPELLTTNQGEVTYADSGITLVLMRFIEGKNFLELDRLPTNEERRVILEQAAKINNIDHDPPYIFDSCAIPNIHVMFDKVRQYIDLDDVELVERAIAIYDAISVNELPHCFVHGDFTKANIIKGDDGKIYILDFSVANRYPRIQELAVIIANLLHDDGEVTLEQKCEQIAQEYSKFNALTEEEKKHLPAYVLAGIAMEFMGAHQEKYINGNNTEETAYWLALGRSGLLWALK